MKMGDVAPTLPLIEPEPEWGPDRPDMADMADMADMDRPDIEPASEGADRGVCARPGVLLLLLLLLLECA